jgi:RNA polymerase sigma-B factor
MAARDELVERLMPLARQLAARYRRRDESFDDLVQVANMALVKAIDRFDADRGTAISTFAVPTILGELRRYFRDSTWSVRVGRTLQERIMRAERASGELASKLGRSPSVRELATAMQLSEEEVIEALEASSAYRPTSLDEPAFNDDHDGGTTLGDTLSTDDGSLALIEDRWTVQSAMRALSDRDRQILRMRFEEDLTQSEIAKQLGVSQMHVSRLLRRALATLRERADDDGRHLRLVRNG